MLLSLAAIKPFERILTQDSTILASCVSSLPDGALCLLLTYFNLLLENY